MNESKQLVLPMQSGDEQSFAHYYDGDNGPIVAALRSIALQKSAAAQWVYLYGPSGTGKSHLLKASCHLAREQGRQSVYLDLAQADTLEFRAQDLGVNAMVCIDQIQQLSAELALQKKLLSLIEMLRQKEAALLMAGDVAPGLLPIELPDLLSRIKGCPSYALQELDDSQKQAALTQMARLKGFELSAEVGRWLLTHRSRDLGDLADFLDRIDTHSLVHKRRVTIPLIKTLS